MQRDFRDAVSSMRQAIDRLEKQLVASDKTQNPVMRHCYLTEANNTAGAITGIFEWLRHDIESDRAALFSEISGHKKAS